MARARKTKQKKPQSTNGVQKPLSKPVYPTGTILVTHTDNGRHKKLHFYKVVSVTKGGAPRVRELKMDVFDSKSDVAGGYTIVKPIPTEFHGDEVKCMRWNKKGGGIYLTADFKSFTQGKRMGVFTEVYNPANSYKIEWLCG